MFFDEVMAEMEYVGKCLLVKTAGKKILAVGDLHLGYEEALNKAGVFVGRHLFVEVLRELQRTFEKVGRVSQVVLLGDIKHTFGRILPQERGDVVKLIDMLAEHCVEIILIKGNHDVILEPIAQGRSLIVEQFHRAGEVVFLHGDKDMGVIWGREIHTIVVGHGHPAINLSDGVKEEKYKCFLEGIFKGKKFIVVPSFAEHSEGTDPREYDLGLAWELPMKKFRVKAVGENLEVLDFGMLKNL